MKYKQLVLAKVEQLDSLIARADVAANRGNQPVFAESIEKLKEQIAELRQLVDLEQEG